MKKIKYKLHVSIEKLKVVAPLLMFTILILFLVCLVMLGVLSITIRFLQFSKSDVLSLLLLLLPFLLSLLFASKFSKETYRSILLTDLDSCIADRVYHKFAEQLLFLVVVAIAFLAFLKSSIYSFLALNDVQSFIGDVFVGWNIFLCTAVKNAYDSVLLERHEQQNAKNKKTITEQRRSKRILIYQKRVQYPNNYRKRNPNT